MYQRKYWLICDHHHLLHFLLCFQHSKNNDDLNNCIVPPQVFMMWLLWCHYHVSSWFVVFVNALWWWFHKNLMWLQRNGAADLCTIHCCWLSKESTPTTWMFVQLATPHCCSSLHDVSVILALSACHSTLSVQSVCLKFHYDSLNNSPHNQRLTFKSIFWFLLRWQWRQHWIMI